MRWSLLAILLLCGACKKPATSSAPPHALDHVLDGLESKDEKRFRDAVGELAKLLNEGSLSPAVVEPRTTRVTAALRDALAKVIPKQQNDLTKCGSWITEELYETLRFPTELLLDLGGMARAPEVVPELEKGLKFVDPQLQWFAARSLLRLGRPIDAATVAHIAGNDTVRGRVFETLSERGSVGLMPAAERTQEALARADLVSWLTYPTELGCEPNEIELVKVVAVGNDDHYVFRFRTDDAKLGQPAKTWLLGVAGPYQHGRLSSHGNGTFSTFTRADQKTAEQYVADIRAVIDNANKKMDPNTKTAPILPGK